MKTTEYLSGTPWNLRDLDTFSTQKSERAHFDQRRSHLTLLRARNCTDRPKILLDLILNVLSLKFEKDPLRGC